MREQHHHHLYHHPHHHQCHHCAIQVFSSPSVRVGSGRKEDAPKMRTAGSVIGDPSHLGPPRHLWEDPMPANAETGLVADSWPGARATSPTAGRRPAKVSLTMSVDHIPREPSKRVGNAGIPPTAGGSSAHSPMTHQQRILEVKGKLLCPMSGWRTPNTSIRKKHKSTLCNKKSKK